MDYTNFKMRKDFILEETMSTFGLSSKYKFIDVTKLSDTNVLEESTTKIKDKYPIYIVVSWCNTIPDKVISTVTRCKYCHAALSLDSSLKKLYSFNLLNHEHNKHGGFSIESLQRYLDDYEDSLMAVFTIFLDKFTFDALKKNIKWFIEHTKETSYSFLNIIAYGLHLPIQFTNRMVCSQFVDNILKRVGVDVTGKRSSQVSAATFYKSKSEYIYKCYEGEIKKYKSSILNKNINKIKNNIKTYSNE